jgi:hypothetical protein
MASRSKGWHPHFGSNRNRSRRTIMATASVGPRTVAANAPVRRNLLSMMAFALVAALPFPARAVTISSRTAWDGMMRAYEVSRAASDIFEKGTYDPAAAAVEREAPYPKMSFRVPYRHGYLPDHPVYPNRLPEWDDHMSPLYRDAAAGVRAKYFAWEAAGKRAELDELEMHADKLKSGATRRDEHGPTSRRCTQSPGSSVEGARAIW